MPLILFEDEHLLVVNKPAGWNTHAPDPYAGEGIYDWLKHREPRLLIPNLCPRNISRLYT